MRLKRTLKRLGVTQRAVAAEAHVTESMVSNVLAGRYTSAKVLAAAERLLAARRYPSGGTPAA